jgi:hypothetical protein
MAITFPRSFPTGVKLFRTANFDLKRVIARNVIGGLNTQQIQLADPRWSCGYSTPPLNRNDAQIWKAWKDSLALQYFYGYDPEQPYPKNYPTGFAGLVKHGTATPLTGLDVDVTATTISTIALTGLSSTFAFKAGDLVGLVQSTNRQVHRVLEDATASSGVVTITVEPFVKTTLFTAAATLNLVKPVCKMFIEEGSWDAPRDIEDQPIQFTGIQAVY